MSAKPYLFLDVDGVLNACPPLPDHETVQKEGFPICIPKGTKERMAKLLEVFEPVWCTTWRDRAHPNFHLDLDLGEEAWPHIEFVELKLLGIIDYACDIHMRETVVTPWVWIDDDGPWEVRRLGLRPDEQKTLILAPDTAKGLEDRHVERALEFARNLDDGA